MQQVVALCMVAIGVSVQGILFGSKDICFVPPEADTGISIDFNMYTRENPDLAQRLTVDAWNTEEQRIAASSFKPSRPTKFIIHGYTDKGNEGSWVDDMAKRMVHFHDVNAITVDWQKRADNLFYGRAASNTQAVGERIAQLIQSLVDITGAKLKDFHVIGHSLGSHVAGFAGSALNGKIGRITGMDPAGPCFTIAGPEKRLSSDDALFVDAIHSDGDNVFQGGFGTELRRGHADFYPNGGEHQPGCRKWLFMSVFDLFKGFEAGAKSVSCSHSRAVEFFHESIDPAQTFTAYPCDHHDHYKNCKKCGADGCTKMGYNASADKKGVFTLITNAESPYSVD